MPKKISRICFKVRVNYCCSGILVSPNFFSRTPLIMILEISKIIFCLVVLMIAFCSKETYESANGFSGFHSSILKSHCNLATPGLSQPFGEWPYTIHILLSLLQPPPLLPFFLLGNLFFLLFEISSQFKKIFLLAFLRAFPALQTLFSPILFFR